jgi:hypothetical protein
VSVDWVIWSRCASDARSEEALSRQVGQTASNGLCGKSDKTDGMDHVGRPVRETVEEHDIPGPAVAWIGGKDSATDNRAGAMDSETR